MSPEMGEARSQKRRKKRGQETTSDLRSDVCRRSISKRNLKNKGQIAVCNNGLPTIKNGKMQGEKESIMGNRKEKLDGNQ